MELSSRDVGQRYFHKVTESSEAAFLGFTIIDFISSQIDESPEREVTREQSSFFLHTLSQMLPE